MSPINAVDLAVFQSAMHSIAEEMGAALRRTAISPNIKERRDYSCAVFDARHRVIAMGDHMPVHLGSMPLSVETAVTALTLGPGDIALLNDPYAGGTHLPDLTMVMPVFRRHEAEWCFAEPCFYVAARAHHADVGGTFPGSMGPGREIFQEGLRIPPVRLVRFGEVDRDLLNLLLLNVRTPEEREGDLAAQLGACRVGEQRLQEVMERTTGAQLSNLGDALLDYSERLVRAQLRTLPAGCFRAEDFLDGAGVADFSGDEGKPVRIAVSLTIDPVAGTLLADFTGSAPQVPGSLNAVRAITLSACFYMLRCLLGEDAPATAGILRPLTLFLPEASIVNAQPPAAVAGGNVETSQRIVDTLLLALAQAAPGRIPAASAGSMSNLTIGGLDTRKDSQTGQTYTYYETTAGGMGAAPDRNGLSGVQTHMTNSLNTPIEALEFAYPLRMLRYSYRPESGGEGLHCGGDGLIKEIELLDDASVTLLADRHQIAPYGLAGGQPGSTGSITQMTPGATELIRLPAKFSQSMKKGTVLRLETPGGGGWGCKP